MNEEIEDALAPYKKALLSIDLDAYGDAVYDVRDRCIDGEPFEGSSWDHPKVLAHSESHKLISELVKQIKEDSEAY